MTMQKKILASALALGIAGLTGCGGDSAGTQDVPTGNNGGSNATQSRALYARAVDGYLAGASVYVDLNENGTLESYEPRAITDNDGFFSYNHLTDTDYCAANAGALSRHCLRASIGANEEVLIRVTGGYDTVTGLPFTGTLSLRSSELDRDDMRLVTPQTSLVADLPMTAEEKFNLLQEAGLIGGRGLDADPLEDPTFTRAQVTAIMARILGKAGDQATNSAYEDLETEAWTSSYIAFAQQIHSDLKSGGAGDFGQLFSSFETTKEAMRRIVFQILFPGQTMPENYTLPNEAAAEPLLQFSTDLVAVVEELIAALQGNGTMTREQMVAVSRAVAVLGERGLNNPHDPELADLAAWLRNQLAHGLGSDLMGLAQDNVDLSVLIDPTFNFDPASNSVSASAVIPAEAATAFAGLVNKAFRVSHNKADAQGAGLFFISGESGATSGDLDICVRYRDMDGDFNTGSSSDPNGAMVITGRWSLLNDHTLTLSVDIVGGVRPLLLKSVGVIGSERKYRFDFGGDLAEWTGTAPSAFTPSAIPANDEQCKAALIEEFGPIG